MDFRIYLSWKSVPTTSHSSRDGSAQQPQAKHRLTQTASHKQHASSRKGRPETQPNNPALPYFNNVGMHASTFLHLQIIDLPVRTRRLCFSFCVADSQLQYCNTIATATLQCHKLLLLLLLLSFEQISPSAPPHQLSWSGLAVCCCCWWGATMSSGDDNGGDDDGKNLTAKQRRQHKAKSRKGAGHHRAEEDKLKGRHYGGKYDRERKLGKQVTCRVCGGPHGRRACPGIDDDGTGMSWFKGKTGNKGTRGRGREVDHSGCVLRTPTLPLCLHAGFGSPRRPPLRRFHCLLALLPRVCYFAADGTTANKQAVVGVEGAAGRQARRARGPGEVPAAAREDGRAGSRRGGRRGRVRQPGGRVRCPIAEQHLGRPGIGARVRGVAGGKKAKIQPRARAPLL